MPFNRRSLLGLAAGGAVGAASVAIGAKVAEDGAKLLGDIHWPPSPPGHGHRDSPWYNPTRVDPATLMTTPTIGTARTFHVDPPTPTAFQYDRAFHARLVRWLNGLEQATGWRIDRIDSTGCFPSPFGRGPSWHDSGRALDIYRLWEGADRRFDAPADLSNAGNNAQRPDTSYPRGQVTYWTVIASMHLYFREILTFTVTSKHQDNVHVDDGALAARDADPDFSIFSNPQASAIREILAELWGFRPPIRDAYQGMVQALTGIRAVGGIDTDGRSGSDADRNLVFRRFMQASLTTGARKLNSG